MDPFTIALATFGVQKLRGKSTRTSLKDAATMAGLGQFAGMAGFGPFQAFGQTSLPGFSGKFLGEQGAPLSQQFLETGPARMFSREGIRDLVGEEKQPELLKDAIKSAGGDKNKIKAAKDLYGGSGLRGLDTGTKIGLGFAGLSLMDGAGDDPKPPFSEEDYKKAYEKNKGALEGIGETFDYEDEKTNTGNVYDFDNQYFAFNQGGIVNALPKYNKGGINYLPSKTDHDEHDINNYIRATGYVEDGSGNGDKDEDTMLAQLADGEFVSRADAILGAGIMEGANPTDMKDMRKKGAAFFYGQQAKLKRIFDLLDAARKEKN
tara:strand:- start:932 stop:1891 length:960 start_codon:yes stop_codon:yes gene_type:complete